MAELITKWPAMKVHPVHLRRDWITDDEIATGHLSFGDGTGIQFKKIDLLPTPIMIHKGAIFTLIKGSGEIGIVAECAARAIESEGLLEIMLDAEPVVLERRQIIAKAMKAYARVILSNGQIWTSGGVEQPEGYGMFPDCPVIGNVAQSLEAKFILQKKG